MSSSENAVSGDALLRVLQLAAHAPSGANGQPWHFEWDGCELLVYFSKNRTPRHADSSDYRGTLVLVGSFLECLEIAATTEGLSTSFTLGLPYEEQHPCLRIVFTASTAPPSDLVQTLAQRYTDRRLFNGGSISDPVFAQVADDWRAVGRHIYYLDHYPSALIEYIVAGEGISFGWRELFQELWGWWRWSNEEAQGTRDGMHWATLGVNYATSRLLKLLGASPVFLTIANRAGVRSVQARIFRKRIRSAAGLALLTMVGSSMEEAFEFGRIMMRSWLRFQQAGYSVGIFGHCAMCQYFNAMGSLQDDFPREYRPWLEEGASVLKRSFGHRAEEFPFLVWRVGRCPGPLPLSMRTLRRDIAPLIRWTGH